MYLLGLGFRSVLPPKGLYFVESLATGEWLVLAAVALVVLLLGLCFGWTQRRKNTPRSQFLPAVWASLVPTGCVLLLSLQAWFGPALPYHVTLSGAKKVYVGMSRAELENALGKPRGWSADEKDHKVRIKYDVQIPWEYSKEFYIDLVDGLVIHSRVVPFGREEDGDFFSNLPPGRETNLGNLK